LLGYQRAIVFDQPGTTRDVLTATTALDGWPVELADTAGLREGATDIEAAGIARAREQIAGADLVIELRDATAEAFPRLQLTSANSLLIVYNKCDLKPPAGDCPPGLAVSAKTGQGIDQLCHWIPERLVPNPPPRGAGVPFTEKQIAGLQESKHRLAGGDVAGAQQSLKMLLTAALDFGRA
jgi:tRNA modification GTPase